MDSSARQLEIFKAQDLQRRASGTTAFFDLPFEVRERVHRYYVPRTYVILNNARTDRTDFDFIFYADRTLRMLRLFPQIPFTTDFLVVSKQVCEECLNILYGENRFELDLARGAQAVLREAFTERNIRRIKDVHVLAHFAEPLPDPGLLPQPDHQFWAMVFPQLTSFVLQTNILATCDDPSRTRWNADRSLRQRFLYLWKDCVERYFVLFGRLLADADHNIKTEISVEPEIATLARLHIPGNFPIRVVSMDQCTCGRSHCTQRR